MLAVNQQDIYLGDLLYGVPHRFEYTLINKYSKPVNIVKLHESCKSCTKATTDVQILAPGKSMDISVNFVPGSTGPALKSISVEHTVEGEVKPPLKLTFRAQVK